jgi:hypothetical protein
MVHGCVFGATACRLSSVETDAEMERLVEAWWSVLEDAIAMSNWEKRKRLALEDAVLSTRRDTLLEVLDFMRKTQAVTVSGKLGAIERFMSKYGDELDG